MNAKSKPTTSTVVGHKTNPTVLYEVKLAYLFNYNTKENENVNQQQKTNRCNSS